MKGKMRRILTVAMVGMLCFSMSLPAAAAQTKEQTQERIEQLEKEKQSLENKLADLKANKTSTEDYIKELDAELNSISSEITDLNSSIETISQNIEDTEKKLEEAKAKEERQYELLKQRIKYMYEQGQVSYIDILLGSESIETLLNSAQYISQISEFDNQLLTSLKEISQEIDAYEKELEANKAEMEADKQTLEGKQEEVNAVTEAKKEELSNIESNIDTTEEDVADVEEDLNNENQILADLEAAEAEAQRQYEELKAQQEAEAQKAKEEAEAAKAAAEEAARIEAEKQQAAQQAAEEAAKAEADKKAEAEAEAEKAQQEADQAAADKEEADQKAEEAQDKAEQSQGSSTGTGSLTWPLPGYTTISSSFGSRICPFHGLEYHNGVDIPAPGGTAIHAADSGVVVAAQYHSSLGNYIIINHGNGIQTYYLHTSAMYVSVGTKVSKGDVIAAVGTTGSSTGNHLDFRVNVNGSYVNPLSYASPY